MAVINSRLSNKTFCLISQFFKMCFFFMENYSLQHIYLTFIILSFFCNLEKCHFIFNSRKIIKVWNLNRPIREKITLIHGARKHVGLTGFKRQKKIRNKPTSYDATASVLRNLILQYFLLTKRGNIHAGFRMC